VPLDRMVVSGVVSDSEKDESGGSVVAMESVLDGAGCMCMCAVDVTGTRSELRASVSASSFSLHDCAPTRAVTTSSTSSPLSFLLSIGSGDGACMVIVERCQRDEGCDMNMNKKRAVHRAEQEHMDGNESKRLLPCTSSPSHPLLSYDDQQD